MRIPLGDFGIVRFASGNVERKLDGAPRIDVCIVVAAFCVDEIGVDAATGEECTD